VAGDDGTHLTLTSPSAVEVQPLETLVRRKFVTRATVTDEAAQAVFGFVGSDAQSIPGSPAELIGTVDLSRGVDLRDGRFLRIAVDNQAPRDIDCAGPRARATVLDEAVAAINAVLPKTASHDGQRLILTARKRILVDARVSDALERLLGILPGAIRGQDATRVSFVSTVDLTAGIALPANASIKIGVDAVAPVEINLAGPQPANRSTGEVAAAINQALQSFYCTVGAKGLIVNSRVLGAESRIEFEAPGGADATSAIFGITAPRVYQGEAALPPEVVGSPDLSGALDLRALRFLRVAIDGAPARDIDCAAASADASAVSLDSIVKAINDQLGKPVASAIGAHLRLSSAALRFEPHTSGSAALKLLGIAQGEATAADATPATIAGLASLPEPFDLSRRPLIRISVNGGRPVDIAAAGPNPSSTSRDEVVAAINRVIPGLASITDDDRVRLSAGDTLSLVPLRYIELLEYPSETAEDSERRLRAGDGWFEINDGAAAAEVSIELTAPFGLAVPTFVNRTSGTIFRVFSNLIAGDTLRVSPDGAEITSAAGERRQVDAGSVQAGPLGSQVHVPFADEWSLNGVPPELQLNDPAAARIVILRARLEDHGYSDVRVTVSAQASGGLFDAVVRSGDVEERYTGVTIGADDGPRSLARQINAGASFGKSSRFVKAEEFAKASALEVPQGRSDWVYLESITARYNHARFNVDRFPGGRSIEPGVFNVSRFANSPPEKGVSVFAPASDFQDVTAVVKFRSERNRPGVFAVNLPADLPSRFGAKFNESRFGEAAGGPETYNQAVTEPESDPQHIKNLINGQPSDFVTAAIVPRVPLGFSPVRIPFRRPRFLSLGDASRPAQIFLAEEGIQGFLALAAKEHGAYGNDIAVTARKSGPAKFDFSIVYRGGRFENAREVARGQALSASVTALSQSSPAGVLEAKAAGVRAIVTREDTQNTFTAQL